MGWTPSLWASRRPFGLGLQRPNNYKEVFRAAWESRDDLGHAHRILRDGCCDGCALGTTGMRDWTLDGTHLCNIRLRLLSLNTMAPLDPAPLLTDPDALRGTRTTELRELGRIGEPLLRRAGERAFSRLSWDDALDLVAERIGATSPDRVAAFLTSRGMPNESYYAAQKAMRAIGVTSIDNAARICHAPSTVALKQQIGVAATTCSYPDVIESDLVVFIGSNPANNQPVMTKYLHHAKKHGARVVCVNPYREPGMERYWIPSIPESAVFGTKIADAFYEVHVGGDLAFLTGALRHIVEQGWQDQAWIDAHTVGFEEAAAAARATDWDALEAAAGCPREEMLAFARELAEAQKAVLVWSMGITQHACGEDNVRAIVNLGLSQGFVGRPGCGLMPIRGHSGVQGGAEMGCYATALPGGVSLTPETAADWSGRWGFAVPAAPGRTAPEMLDAAATGDLDVLLSAGGNWMEVLPDPHWVEAALEQVGLRVHLDLVLTPQMLVGGGDVLVLPAASRYEIPGGCTSTSTERRIIFSPEIPGSRVPQARGEWEVFGEIAARVRPELRERVRFSSTQAVRDEIGRLVPLYAGIETLREKGDQVQYGGRRLCEGGQFPLPDGRARFVAAAPPVPVRPTEGEARVRVTTRRGKQFNSMVHEDGDAITGARREDVLLSAEDVARFGLRDGDRILLRNGQGELAGRVRVAELRAGNAQVHWPEGNVLLDRKERSPEAGVPDYNAWVTVERA